MSKAEELAKKLDERGNTGCDLSPGDPVCKEAAALIREQAERILGLHQEELRWNDNMNRVENELEIQDTIIKTLQADNEALLKVYEAAKGLCGKIVLNDWDEFGPLRQAITAYEKGRGDE